jgi:hypothetical protein
MPLSPNVLPTPIALTQSAFRAAVSETIVKLQNGSTDQDMADLWGVSAGTVSNCRNKANDLSAVPLLKLARTFGPAALNTVLSMVGAKAVPIEHVHIDVAAIPCNVAATVPTLIRLLADGDASDADIRQLDREGVIDCFTTLADMLNQRRDELRLRIVA